MSSFQTFMSDYRADRAELLDIYPADENLLQGFDSSHGIVLFVDVGGGRGHEIEKFQERFPQEKSQMVLQDLPHILEEVPDSSTMEHMAYVKLMGRTTCSKHVATTCSLTWTE